MRRHTGNLSSHVVRRRGRGAVGSTDTRVVLGSAPGEADAGVADRVSLHLIDRHLGRVTMDELNETASLAGGNLDVGDFAEALEEGTELILGDVAREAANEDCRVVRVGELIHGLAHVVEGARLVVKLGRDTPHGSGMGLGDGGSHLTRSDLSVSVLMGTARLLGMHCLCQLGLGHTYRVLGVAVEMRMGRLPQYTPCISTRARCWSDSSLKRTKPYPRDWPVMASVMILADLQDGKRD